MDIREKRWLFVLIAIFVIANVLTFSPLVPWQKWILWSDPEPSQIVNVQYGNYEIKMNTPVVIKKGEYVEFKAGSTDVTYGFGVFRKDNSMVFQMQVMPGQNNHIMWNFDEAGWYDVRSTEYSGPKHSDMVLRDAIQVVE
jgi:cytochrome c oxidase subunit 2